MWKIQSLPPLENITVTAANPRLTHLVTNGMLGFSVEFFVDWEHLHFEGNFITYEVYFGYKELLPYEMYDGVSSSEITIVVSVNLNIYYVDL